MIRPILFAGEAFIIIAILGFCFFALYLTFPVQIAGAWKKMVDKDKENTKKVINLLKSK
jgi:hypothetical protein